MWTPGQKGSRAASPYWAGAHLRCSSLTPCGVTWMDYDPVAAWVVSYLLTPSSLTHIPILLQVFPGIATQPNCVCLWTCFPVSTGERRVDGTGCAGPYSRTESLYLYWELKSNWKEDTVTGTLYQDGAGPCVEWMGWTWAREMTWVGNWGNKPGNTPSGPVLPREALFILSSMICARVCARTHTHPYTYTQLNQILLGKMRALDHDAEHTGTQTLLEHGGIVPVSQKWCGPTFHYLERDDWFQSHLE